MLVLRKIRQSELKAGLEVYRKDFGKLDLWRHLMQMSSVQWSNELLSESQGRKNQNISRSYIVMVRRAALIWKNSEKLLNSKDN